MVFFTKEEVGLSEAAGSLVVKSSVSLSKALKFKPVWIRASAK
jgi:hypothetical protein